MSIASKNLYELLGNDADQDPDLKEPELPTKAIDKPTARSGKRNAPAEAPSRAPASSAAAPSRAPRQQRDTGNTNENAFKDRGIGSEKNRSRGSGEPRGRGDGEGGYRGRGRGRGRGGAGGDRHSRTGIADHEKQAAHGWGGPDGGAELADENAGEAIAQQEQKEGAVAEGEAEGGFDGEAAAEAEPEDKSKSYAAYLAEQAEKKLSLAAQKARQPNEGSKQKLPEGKELSRDEEDDFIAGHGGKTKRTRERKEKSLVELDDTRPREERRDNFGRGRGRGGDRGGRGRGEFRGRGRGEGRGDGRGDGGRGGARGGRGGQSGPNVSDPSAFPSLGA
ncbi:hypothetical protein EJ04DRAFT_549727 [Polyplosphaeria fusca]|uniref:Hyaluronan/mRNA-binding protein domain-containing protein n=1 Tax=Polyplosphaeria fusca TaxID=682080 RepID=A0A9P4R8W2_9PLEO|nr:hypothetical protein EJ04DRAFT_549727 [Polyplosphaeria fusca]